MTRPDALGTVAGAWFGCMGVVLAAVALLVLLLVWAFAGWPAVAGVVLVLSVGAILVGRWAR